MLRENEMDLHGDDGWIFDNLENDHSNENKRPLLCKTSTKTFKDSDFIKLKESINHHELKQKANEDEKRVFVENFYRLLITARSQISKLEEKNKELTDKLGSYMGVRCPNCDHSFRANNSRILPNYIRYVKACNRLELDFKDVEDLKRWLRVSNLDTDANGLPVIQKDEKIATTLKDVGSQFVQPNNTSKKVEKLGYRLEVENLSSRVSISELIDMFNKVAKVVDAHLNPDECNKAVVYFNYHNHLIRVIEKYQGKTLNGRRLKLVDKSPRSIKSPRK